VISNPEVKRTLATLRKAEFGFLGVIVEKLTDKSPLLPLYRTVHEIFISYGSSFNSFEVIGSFSSFENLFPSSTPFRRVTRTNSVTFSFIWNLGSSTLLIYLFFYYFSLSFLFLFLFLFYSFPSLLKCHRFDPVESDSFSH
jgi:hypothetical protein